MQEQSTTSIPLYRRDGSIVAYSLIDVSDLPFVTPHIWRYHASGYAVRYEGYGGRAAHVRINIFLHRELLDLPRQYDGREGDHINRDKLDNRRSNLRVGTHAQNMENTPSQGGTSKYRGVSWNGTLGYWVGYVTVCKRRVWYRYFHTEAEAAEAVVAQRRILMPYSAD